ncbi:hypothetical protein B0T11DRAFT_340481 [Plectosphaerella cucumerina]|uniref:DUF7770 domain-containing protein n=1 Tax=Plectosphaerella cucumerina TaxID=40658 RepID=A0A8K0X2U5_9PEZI|nr:hypothetical protein B0T11DRAFT_340481 [Plectosphaerella cucumerina]
MAAHEYPNLFQIPMPLPLDLYALPSTSQLPTPPVSTCHVREKPESPFEPIMIIPMAQEQQIRNTPIHGLLLVAHDPPNPRPNHSRNRWTIYLPIGGHHFINLDPFCTVNRGYARPNGLRGTLIVSASTSADFVPAHHVCRISLHPAATVSNVLNTIIGFGRHRFEFDADGRGGRGWIMDVIDALQAGGLVSNPIEAAKARMELQMEWHKLVNKGIRVPIYRCGYH